MHFGDTFSIVDNDVHLNFFHTTSASSMKAISSISIIFLDALSQPNRNVSEFKYSYNSEVLLQSRKYCFPNNNKKKKKTATQYSCTTQSHTAIFDTNASSKENQCVRR